jgi:hypothetical protein
MAAGALVIVAVLQRRRIAGWTARLVQVGRRQLREIRAVRRPEGLLL